MDSQHVARDLGSLRSGALFKIAIRFQGPGVPLMFWIWPTERGSRAITNCKDRYRSLDRRGEQFDPGDRNPRFWRREGSPDLAVPL